MCVVIAPCIGSNSGTILSNTEFFTPLLKTLFTKRKSIIITGEEVSQSVGYCYFIIKIIEIDTLNKTENKVKTQSRKKKSHERPWLLCKEI